MKDVVVSTTSTNVRILKSRRCTIYGGRLVLFAVWLLLKNGQKCIEENRDYL
jgi:hypothetical protein